MNPFSKIKENLFSIFQIVLIVLLILLVVIFVVVMLSENPERIFNLLGTAKNGESKYETLKFLGISMGGILIALQALMSYRRAKAMEDTAKSQADAAKAQAKATEEQAKANLHTEHGQRQDRLKNAIEHLGHESDSVRLGGAYELFHLAEDTEELRQTVLDILCAHIRRTTGEIEYRETHDSKPSEEVQSLLTLLFVQEHEVFKGRHTNLQGSWLNGADLKMSRLEKAKLTKAHLQGLIFSARTCKGRILSKPDYKGLLSVRHTCKGLYFVRHTCKRLCFFRPNYKGLCFVGHTCKGRGFVRHTCKGRGFVRHTCKGLLLTWHTCKGLLLSKPACRGQV